MAWKVLKTCVLPIGIDLGTSSVKVVQLRRVRGQLELMAAVRTELPPPCRDDQAKRMEFLADHLRDLVKSKNFKGRQCAVSLPAASTFVQHVRTAIMDSASAELDKALRWELEGKLPFNHADAIVRHVVAGQLLGGHEGGQEVIVMAAAREVVEAYLQLLRHAKLDVVALNVEPCAILQCFARLLQRADDTERTTLFLDLGQSVTQVVIARGPDMVFARNLMFGARHIDDAAAAAVGTTPEEVGKIRSAPDDSPAAGTAAERIYAAAEETVDSLAGDVMKCLRYVESTFPSDSIERVVFLGGQAQDRRLCQMLAQRLNLPAQVGDPFARIANARDTKLGIDVDRRQAQPAWAVAVGLSLGADAVKVA